MRRLLIITTALLTTTVFGQQNKFDIGIEGSPSLIMLRGQNFAKNSYSPALGFSGGLFFQYKFPKTFSLRTNVTFERKGSGVDEILTDNNGEAIAEAAFPNHFDYITAPILLRTTFGNKIKYFINAGPFFGYLFKQTVVYKKSGIISALPDSDNTDLYKKFDTGIAAGFGIEIPIKDKFAFSLEMRDNFGLLNVSKAQTSNSTIKTNSTNILIGFTYRLSKRKTKEEK